MTKFFATIAMPILMANVILPIAQTHAEKGRPIMSSTLVTNTIPVHSASIYVERRGAGPNLLLLPGGAQDAGVFSSLADALSDKFTVITLDPRCNSRSPCENMTRDLNVDQHADDAAAVLAAYEGGPAFVFGTSGGAQVALSLAARHPELVCAVVAHEPPAMMLMADPSAHLAAAQALQNTYWRDGVKAAIAQFMAENGLDASDGAPPEMSPADLLTFARMNGNFEYWLAHGMLPLSKYRAEVEVLKVGTTKITLALGADSAGQPIHEMGLALAAALGLHPTTFPGDHMGFASDPEGFAAALVLALKC